MTSSYTSSMLRNILALALPVLLTSIAIAMVNLSDIFMVGQLGETEVASVGLVYQFLQVVTFILYGVSGGGVIFVTQYFGSGNIQGIKDIFSICLVSSLVLVSLFSLGGMLFSSELVGAFSNDILVINAGSRYLEIIVFSLPFLSITIVYAQILSGLRRTVDTMWVCLIGFFINVVLNYLLIFGVMGFPSLGLMGAAIATVVSRALEASLIVSISVVRKYPLNLFPLTQLQHKSKLFRSYLRVGMPIVASYFSGVFGITCLYFIYGRLGTSELAAMNIFASIERVAYASVISLGVTAGILIGQALGSRKYRRASQLALLVNRYGLVYAVAIATLLALSVSWWIEFYDISEDGSGIAKHIIWAFCLYLPLSTLNTINLIGVLRAGGETHRVFITDFMCMWCITIPTALCGYLMEIPLPILFLAAIGGAECIKFLFTQKRVVEEKWVNSIC